MPKWVHYFYLTLHASIAILFGLASVALVCLAVKTGLKAWGAEAQTLPVLAIVEALGVLAAAIVSVQISQTILEEEIIRQTHISGPSRIRRFMSRFLVMLVVALVIEGLIAAFKAQKEPNQLLYASVLIVAVAILLMGWGVFVRCNIVAEYLEPESLEEAKEEDEKLEHDATTPPLTKHHLLHSQNHPLQKNDKTDRQQ